MMQRERDRGTRPLDPDAVDKLRTWLAADGEGHVLVEIGVSRFGVARLAAGLPVHAATRAAALAALARRGE